MKKKLGRETVEQIFRDHHEDYKLVDQGEWTPQGRYEYCNRIFEDQDGDFWKVVADRIRSQSLGQDYQYHSKIIQVEKEEVVITKWEPVSEQMDVL